MCGAVALLKLPGVACGCVTPSTALRHRGLPKNIGRLFLFCGMTGRWSGRHVHSKTAVWRSVLVGRGYHASPSSSHSILQDSLKIEIGKKKRKKTKPNMSTQKYLKPMTFFHALLPIFKLYKTLLRTQFSHFFHMRNDRTLGRVWATDKGTRREIGQYTRRKSGDNNSNAP